MKRISQEKGNALLNPDKREDVAYLPISYIQTRMETYSNTFVERMIMGGGGFGDLNFKI